MKTLRRRKKVVFEPLLRSDWAGKKTRGQPDGGTKRIESNIGGDLKFGKPGKNLRVHN